VKAAAPQAPVIGSGKTAKNRKTPGLGHSTALERAPGKGTVLFQKLMSARTAAKNAAALPGPEAEGLKAPLLLAALLKGSPTAPAGVRRPAELPVSGILSAAAPAQEKPETAPAQEKLEAARKGAHPKTHAVNIPVGQVAVQAETHQKTQGFGKEQKRDTGEPSKAPVIEARLPAARAEPLIRILDLRRADKPRAAAETADARRVIPASADKDPAAGITLKLGATRETFVETVPKPVPAAGSSGQTPMERLREMAGSELVRASNLVLKDGGGEIRLVLKPESLGSVRIRMNVVDNAIEGRIIVDSAAIKHVFDGSVDALRRALTAEGFQTGSLQVSVGGQNTDAEDRRRQDEAPAVRRVVAQGFERNVPGVENVSLGDLFVNLFA
jgi:flagellar hook-length control protein FliK